MNLGKVALKHRLLDPRAPHVLRLRRGSTETRRCTVRTDTTSSAPTALP